MDYLLPFNKPKNITSATMTNIIKSKLKKFGLKKPKVGHGGTLDKFATGVMVIGINKGTKLLSDYLSGNKTYIATGIFGSQTETYGPSDIIKTKEYKHITREKLEFILNKFIGKIEQTPPIYSALKINGKRASDLAREGKKISLKKRIITIYSIDILDFSLPKFTLKIKCGGGTYIRSLINDIGIELNSYAYISELTRTINKFTLDECLNLNFELDDIKNSKYKIIDN